MDTTEVSNSLTSSEPADLHRRALRAHMVLWPVLLVAVILCHLVANAVDTTDPSRNYLVINEIAWWVGIPLPLVLAGAAAAFVLRTDRPRLILAALVVLAALAFDAIAFFPDWYSDHTDFLTPALTVEGAVFGTALALAWLIVRGLARNWWWCALVGGILPAVLNATSTMQSLENFGDYAARSLVYVLSTIFAATVPLIARSIRAAQPG